MKYKIFVINPGSTSTKIALFENKNKIFAKSVSHDSRKLKSFKEIVEQLPYREEVINNILKEEKVSLEGTSAFAGRGGGLPPMHGGVFRVNQLMCDDAKVGLGVKHPGLLGPLLAKSFSEKFGGLPVIVNPPGTDELQPEARITGFNDVFRISRVHALNQKEVAIRYANKIGKKYEELRLVIAHMGGGISVTAHCLGKMIDTVDISNGDGHMAPTRSGFIPAASLIKLCFSGKYSEDELQKRVNQTGGWIDHLGTADCKEVETLIDCGNDYAKLIYNATQYQIAKSIGAYATVLCGNVDAIIFTGGLSNSERFVSPIANMVKYIAPISIYPGEYEMEALAFGALRVLANEERLFEYDGKPVWNGFDDLK